MSLAIINGPLVPVIAACTAVCVGLLLALIQAHMALSGMQRDLIAAKEAQKNKESQLTQRSELDTIKDEFISTVSHELRTPLTSIRGALGLLSAGALGTVDGKAQNLLRIAVTNTDRLIRLINDILDLERMQSGRAPMQVRRCSMRDLAQQAVETMAPMAEGAQVQLVLAMNTSQEAVFFDGDSDRILQVLTNLLSNAIKFSPPQSNVRLGIDADESSVLLRVSDQGRGIPADKLDAIFDRFQQVENADARQKGGTGLGLAICRTIVEQHAGTIWAESNNLNHRGPGASLLVSLPRLSRLGDPATHSLALLSDHGHSQIVLCDDDAGVRAVVGEHLRSRGYQILEAEDGEEAIRLAEENSPAAILLDLNMPGMTGWETLRRLKHSPATAQIPVVILSVLGPADVAEGLVFGSNGSVADQRADVQGWVQKPYDEGNLLGELGRVLHAGEGQPQVLLVEDDTDLAAVVAAGFEEANVHVHHASTREQAIEHCQHVRPDLIILDLRLPDGDGFSLVDWLRQQPGMRSLPLVVYSGREVLDAEKPQLRLGPTQFLTKAKVQPREVEELVLKIVKTLRVSDAPAVEKNGTGKHAGGFDPPPPPGIALPETTAPR